MVAAEVAPSFVVRALGLPDAPAYKKLRDDALQRTPSSFTSDFETERERTASSYAGRFEGPDGRTFTLGAFAAPMPGTAHAPSPLLGAATLESSTKRNQSHLADLVGMMVAPGAQGAGIARALLGACLARARQNPQLRSVILTVTANNPRAIALYRHAGFAEYGLLPGAIRLPQTGGADFEYFDKLHMILKLHT